MELKKQVSGKMDDSGAAIWMMGELTAGQVYVINLRIHPKMNFPHRMFRSESIRRLYQ